MEGTPVVTLLCKRCGTNIEVHADPVGAEGLAVHVDDHACSRYLVAEHWVDGELNSRWTSRIPAKTGPDSLVLHHAKDADEGWHPPSGESGWTYRWVDGTDERGNE